jgi:Zn-dependent protease
MPGSIRLFRFLGIDVFIHWTWIVVAALLVSTRQHVYVSPVWNALEYLTLFVFVLLHEFGHSLACRQVGGRSNQIMLWPLGGVAYVAPPPRPGAVLWSLVAGPLVNVVLIPILLGTSFLLSRAGVLAEQPELAQWLWSITVINFVLLIFNLLPVYPLDGGQILRSLLWFVIGPRRSLRIAAGVGLVGVVGLALLAFYWRSIWLGVVTVYLGMNCWSAFKAAGEGPVPPAPTDPVDGPPRS